MSKLSSILAIYALSASLYSQTRKDSNNRIDTDSLTGDKYSVIPKGCKVFDINGIEIIALNEKSAIRKYNNRHK